MSGRSCCFALWVAVFAPASATEGSCPPDILEPASTFDAGDEGVYITNLFAWGPGGTVDWSANGGNPGGFVTGGEITSALAGPTYYFYHPGLSGDRSIYEGGTLRLDVRRNEPLSETFCPDCADVILVGEDFTLQILLEPKPPGGGTWTSYALPLAAGGGWHEAPQYEVELWPFAADEAAIREVLAQLRGIVIRADGAGDVGIDNVALTLPSEADSDGDGHHALVYGGDCDDTDPERHPCAVEIWYDGIDQRCDGGNDYDADGDGYDAVESDGIDCDDSDPNVHPDAWDPGGDEVDSDCYKADEGCGCNTGIPSPWLTIQLAIGIACRRRTRT